jgi:uncharacterized protein
VATVEELSREECFKLLQYRSYVGRIGFVIEGRPVVLPVNYIAERGSVFFCTEGGSKLSVASGGARVAFEVDDSKALYHSGWSVLVLGTAHEVTDADELARLRRGPLKSWAVHPSAHWVRVSIDTISGRRLPEV